MCMCIHDHVLPRSANHTPNHMREEGDQSAGDRNGLACGGLLLAVSVRAEAALDSRARRAERVRGARCARDTARAESRETLYYPL